jgi:WD40 repeat protein
MLAVEAWFSHKALILDVETGLPLRCDLRDFWTAWWDHAGLRWSPEGRRIAYRRNGDVVIVTLPPGQHEVLLRGVGHGFGSLAWSPDGTAVATCSADCGTLIWDAASGTQRKKLTIPWSHDAAWSPDGTMLAVAGGKSEVWDAKTWQLRYSFARNAVATAWSPDTRTVVFGGGGDAIEARDLETGSVRWTVADYNSGFAFSPQGKTLAVGRDDGDLDFLDATTGQKLGNIPWHPGLTGDRGAAFSPDGSQLAVAKSREMRFWDVKTGSLIGACHLRGSVAAVVWSADGKAIATSGDPSQIWDAASRECVHEVRGGPSYATNGCVGLSPDVTRLANDDGKMIRFWDLAAERQLLEIPCPDARYSLSPDGKTLAVAAENGVKLYNATTAVPPGSLKGPERLEALAWSADGKALSALCDETIHLWDVASGQHTADSASPGDVRWLGNPRQARGHDSACWLDETTLVVGNIYGVCVWDRRSRAILRTVHGYPASYHTCCYSPDAHLVAFPSDGLIRLQSLDDGRMLYTLLSLRADLTGVVGPEGHWRGAPGLEKELVYVVQTERGQETLAPEAFAKKYGWQNDPSKATK